MAFRRMEIQYRASKRRGLIGVIEFKKLQKLQHTWTFCASIKLSTHEKKVCSAASEREKNEKLFFRSSSEAAAAAGWQRGQ